MKKFRAILWDVYGTLLQAPRGDLDSLVRRRAELLAAFEQTAREFQLDLSPEQLCQRFLDGIASARSRLSRHPEIRIEEVWLQLTPQIAPRRIAFYFEQQANPKRPMPGARETVLRARERGLRQGIVSNAQFYTRIELSELIGDNIFDPDLMFLSCDLGVAKPDLTAFRLAAETLARSGIQPSECLYVGDSLENDIRPARAVGFEALLFGPNGDLQELSQLLERL